jgi:hypothetical protein
VYNLVKAVMLFTHLVSLAITSEEFMGGTAILPLISGGHFVGGYPSHFYRHFKNFFKDSLRMSIIFSILVKN